MKIEEHLPFLVKAPNYTELCMPPVVADGNHSQLPFVLDMRHVQYLLLCFNKSWLKQSTVATKHRHMHEGGGLQ